MKIFILLVGIFVGACHAQEQHLDYLLCAPDLCSDKCVAPNNAHNRPDRLSKHSEYDCYCSCGIVIGDECEDDDECAMGTYCGSAEDGNVQAGVCRTLCDHPNMHCNSFSRCEMENHQPKCVCDLFVCSDTINQPVCGEGNRDFMNRCLFENYNCERMQSEEGIESLTLLGHGTCAEVQSNGGSYVRL
ncbi:uncharacterized protein LOC102802850 [Saccoglossus kowalevskii]